MVLFAMILLILRDRYQDTSHSNSSTKPLQLQSEKHAIKNVPKAPARQRGATPDLPPESPAEVAIGKASIPRGNLQRTGYYEGAGLKLNPDVLWKYETKALFLQEPIIAGNQVFVGANEGSGNRGKIVSLELTSGKLIWSREIPKEICTPAIIAGKNLVFGTFGGDLVALDATTGKDVWLESFGSRIFCPIYKDGILLIACTTGVAACDPNNGTTLWQIDAAYIISNPVVWQNYLFVMTNQSKLYAIAIDQKKTDQIFNYQENCTGQLAVIGNDLLMQRFPGFLLRLDLLTWKSKKTFKSPGGESIKAKIEFDPALSPDKIAWGRNEINVSSVSTQKVLFSMYAGSHPSICGDIMYTVDGGGLTATDLKSGKETTILSSDVIHNYAGNELLPAPVLFDGKALICTHSGTIFLVG